MRGRRHARILYPGGLTRAGSAGAAGDRGDRLEDDGSGSGL